MSREVRTAKDFFRELIQGSQPRPGFLAERERWLRSLQVDGREELLFEFEMLLRGVERYFNLHNLPLESGRAAVARDFHAELEDVRDAIDQAIRLARLLLDPGTDQKLVFRRYIESQLADDRTRRELIEEELDQRTPQESLFVLRMALDALRTIIDHLLKLELCSLSLFAEVGTLALREIVLNPYFRPFRPLEFRIEYDRVKSVALLEALRELEAPERAPFSVLTLALFRNLHYLSYVGGEEGTIDPRDRVVLALVHSETVSLLGYLRGEVASLVTGKRHQAIVARLARDIGRESERIAREHLSSPDAKSQRPIEAALAFTRLFRGQLVLMAHALGAIGKSDNAFDQLTSVTQRGERLRRDLYAFATVCRSAAAALRSEGTGPARGWESLRAFIGYFHDVSYQLLRYGDYEAIDRFCALVLELERLPNGKGPRERLIADCELFAQVLDATFAHVSRRAELASHGFDALGAQELARSFEPRGRVHAATSS